MKKKILAMTFPKQNTSLGLESSILTVVPNDKDEYEVEYILEQWNIKYSEDDIKYYMCSVYITGMIEFFNWAKKHDKNKKVPNYTISVNEKDLKSNGYTLNGFNFRTDISEKKVVNECFDY